MAENKRPPFDLPEGESEIIAGYLLEYSGMRFGLFYMSEFIEVVVIGALLDGALPRRLVDSLALAGRRSSAASTPRLRRRLRDRPLHGRSTCVTFLLKVDRHDLAADAIRWTLPRFRYDQVMDLCWKIILPLSLVNIFVTGVVILLRAGGHGVSVAGVFFYVFGARWPWSRRSAMVLNVRNTVAAAMSLVVTMIALAGIYVLLDAHLVAVLQIMVYAGAIVVLFLFVVMLLEPAPRRLRAAARSGS